MIRSSRSRDMTKYCYFHEDHRHETNDYRELRHQIEEAVRSGQLSHLVKGIKKGKMRVSDTQQGIKKENKETTPVKAPVLMISRQDQNQKRKSAGELINGLGEITFPHVSGSNNSSDPVIIKARISERERMGILVSIIHGAIKFHTPKGIGTMLSTYKPPERDERKKKSKATCSEITKNVLSCKDAEERIIVNTNYPEQTVAIGRQLLTSIKERLQKLIIPNVDVFAWTYADMTGIPRTIMVGGKSFNTEHKLNEYNHIKPIKQKRRGLGSDRNKVACREVEELTKAGILRKVKN
ncbi:hypothetical protein Tco_1511535 [Tanacetum coccineum]